MKNRILIIVIGLIVLNIATYWLFSETSSEKIINNKYLDFTQRRVENIWNTDASEHVFVASCGDEFFRSFTSFEVAVKKSNPRHKEYLTNLHTEDDFYQTIVKVDDDIDVLRTIQAETDSLKSRNCIIYKVCTVRTIPAFLKKIEYQYFYSDSPTNFHNMIYNGQVERSIPTYFWLFGFWIEFDGQINSLN